LPHRGEATADRTCENVAMQITLSRLRALLAPLAVAALVAAPGVAHAAPPAADPLDLGPKSDKSLGLVAQEAQARGGPQALVRVIAYGQDAGHALEKHADDVTELPLIGAYTATVRVASLNALTRAKDIDGLTVDVPVKTTGAAPAADATVTL